MTKQYFTFRFSKNFALRIVSFAVFGNGVLILFNSLASHIILRRHFWNSRIQINLGIIIGLTLIYLSSLLARRKHTAWLLTVCLYAFTVGANIAAIVIDHPDHAEGPLAVVRALFVPVAVVLGLVIYAREFTVKSDIKNFAVVLRRVAMILVVALLYGVIGFEILERRDFRQELNLWQSIGYTVDQFGIFTKEPLHAFTYRGKAFLDSLSLISGLSLSYAFVALFQPIRARLSDQTPARQHVQTLLEHYHGSSEDFFKLWPHDKNYIFSDDGQAAIAYHVTSGVALAVGDPIGKPASIDSAIHEYMIECRTNDWLPTFVHTEGPMSETYKVNGFAMQKIGEEAVVEINTFLNHQIHDKYFRQIYNKFSKHGYIAELLSPPHNAAVLQRLKQVSDEWLDRPGRSERGVLMGYFSEEYLQQAPVMVLRDAAGTIQAFINQVESYDPGEANFDMLRYSKLAPGNSNDFLLIEFMKHLQGLTFARLNLGLCPLAGVGDDDEQDPTIVDTVVRFVYANGDRIYSFSGLHRFKSKYDPLWRDRYIAYKGGVRALPRTVRALTKAMKR